jgi:hypothetical protein
MRYVGNCQWSLFGRLLMFCVRKTAEGGEPTRRFCSTRSGKANATPAAPLLTDQARSAA